VNFKPKFTAFPSPASTTDGVTEPNTEHGHDAGDANGVATFDGADTGPDPTPFVATTVNVYPVPFVKPDTVTDVADAPADTGVWATEPTNGVTVYPDTAPPDTGATHDTDTEPEPTTDATTCVTAPGTAPPVEPPYTTSTK
jgi:hypothetical protein